MADEAVGLHYGFGKLSGPSCSKTRKNSEITIQWITINKKNHAIRWIVNSRVNSVFHLSNNLGLVISQTVNETCFPGGFAVVIHDFFHIYGSSCIILYVRLRISEDIALFAKRI